ncbi:MULTISPECIES: hypothetical protein [Amycolatopsis]|nr:MULTISPECIES: hypothetical protein [Amycolatopsis]
MDEPVVARPRPLGELHRGVDVANQFAERAQHVAKPSYETISSAA